MQVRKTENKIADEETAKKIIAALEKEPKTLAGDRYVYFSAQMENLLREYRRACQYITTIYGEKELDTNDFLFRRQGTRLPMTLPPSPGALSTSQKRTACRRS